MEKIILLLLLGLVFYLLYTRGYLILNSKRAAMFVGSLRGKDGCKATFTACSGYLKRVFRFPETRDYHFVLEAPLTKGELTVELLDGAGEPVACLDGAHPTATVAAERNRRYYLVARFRGATGSFQLNWK